jgi:hypothetical protein
VGTTPQPFPRGKGFWPRQEAPEVPYLTLVLTGRRVGQRKGGDRCDSATSSIHQCGGGRYWNHLEGVVSHLTICSVLLPVFAHFSLAATQWVGRSLRATCHKQGNQSTTKAITYPRSLGYKGQFVVWHRRSDSKSCFLAWQWCILFRWPAAWHSVGALTGLLKTLGASHHPIQVSVPERQALTLLEAHFLICEIGGWWRCPQVTMVAWIQVAAKVAGSLRGIAYPGPETAKHFTHDLIWDLEHPMQWVLTLSPLSRWRNRHSEGEVTCSRALFSLLDTIPTTTN